MSACGAEIGEFESRWGRQRISSLRSREIDESSLYVGAEQFDAQSIADVKSLEPSDYLAFCVRVNNTYPGAFLGRAGDDGVEALPDFRFEE